jgi:PLP dependent protein
MLTAAEIARRLGAVHERVASAAARARRDPAPVRILLASKTQPPDALRAAYEAGAREFGENYVQEAAAKRRALADLAEIHWHLIGHLQTNKARQAAATFELIHTLDSARLADALDRAHAAAPVRVLIEVNMGGEATKFGIAPDGVEGLIERARAKVEIAGLMTIPPPQPEPESARRYFAGLRELRGRLAGATGLALSELSMGMSDDFEVAIEEGATIVRIGRAVFGERAR